MTYLIKFVTEPPFQKEELFKAADENGDGVVSMDELAMLLAVQQEKYALKIYILENFFGFILLRIARFP